MWRARIAALSFLQVVVFNNLFSVIENDSTKTSVVDIVTSALHDHKPEVRQMASQVLSGLFHCNLLPPDQTVLVRLFYICHICHLCNYFQL